MADQISFADYERQTATKTDMARQIREMLDTFSAMPGDERERLQLRSQEDAATMCMARMSHLEQEEMHVISLDTKLRVLDVTVAYRGSVGRIDIRIAELFRAAIRANAVSIIIAHNHPSGDSTPSPEDVRTTRTIVDGGKILNVDVLDHLVIGRDTFTSLRQRKLGFD